MVQPNNIQQYSIIQMITEHVKIARPGQPAGWPCRQPRRAAGGTEEAGASDAMRTVCWAGE